jgi:hypothetical protein
MVVAGSVIALALTSCGKGAPSGSASTVTTARPTTSTTALATKGGGVQWSGALTVSPGVDLSVVSCPVVGFCMAGSTSGQTYRLAGRKPSAIGPAVGAPSPQGVSYLTCTSATFCAAVPDLNQAALFNGTGWAAPTTIAAAQGFTAIGCVGVTFCVSIDGEGNSFVYNGAGWSGNVGAWGAANQISCANPTFCVAAEGGPSIWNGRTWSQPNDADTQGQLNSVSCASPTFCVAVDSAGDALVWNGSAFSAPALVATEPPTSGTDASGLTGVSCPATNDCVAVDSIGRAFTFDGSHWSAGTLIDSGGALTSVSCPSTSVCVAVDRKGHAYVSGALVSS